MKSIIEKILTDEQSRTVVSMEKAAVQNADAFYPWADGEV